MRRLAVALAVAAVGLAAAAVSRAQPMMPDPSAMSGIPRPDSTVPPGKLVVRVIRGDFSHPMVGTEVMLNGPDGAKTASVGPDGRASFEGLALGGPYGVRATSGDQTVTSQPIPMPGEMGVKVMLVFKPDEKAALAEHDGVARPDKSLPAGTLVISVFDEANKPLANLPVVVAHGAAPAAGGQPRIEQANLTTDDKGEARYVAAAGTTGEGLMVSVKKEPLSAASQPFQLDATAGMRLGLRAAPRTQDATSVVINRKSHLIFDVKDDTVEVIENLTIENRSGVPYDPGKPNLVFMLPEGAQGAQQVGEPTRAFTVSGNMVLVHAPIAPGETAVAFGFVMAQKDGGVDVRQTLPVRMEQLVGITSRFPGMEVRGENINRIERTMNGRTFFLLHGGEVPAGGTLHLGLSGLPHRSPWASYLAVAVAAFIGLWGLRGLVASMSAAASASASTRLAVTHLEAEKKRLFDELAALERNKPGTARAEEKHARRRDELTDRLEHVLRDLDEQPGGGGAAG